MTRRYAEIWRRSYRWGFSWEIWADSIVDTCTNPYKPTKYARNGRTRDVFEIWKNEKFASIAIRNLSGFSRKLFFLIIEYCEHENCRNRTSQVNKYELLHTYETKHTFLAFFSSEPGGHKYLHLHLSFSGKLATVLTGIWRLENL